MVKSPTLLAHFEENREFYLAQEFIEGGTAQPTTLNRKVLARSLGDNPVTGNF